MAYDNAIRSNWLAEQVIPELGKAFPFVAPLTRGNLLVTVGFPSSGARGRSEKIRPAELNRQWTGNEGEKDGMLSIHPIYFDRPRNVLAASLFGLAKHISARWGPSRVGLEKNGADIIATPEVEAKLAEIVALIPEPPSGYGVPFPVRQVSRGRLRRYTASGNCSNGEPHPVIRSASDTLNVTCQCGAAYILG